MSRTIPEADWKLLSQLKPVALERVCQRVLDEIAKVAAGSESAHARYLALYALVTEQDAEIADAFDDFRRSNALFRLCGLRTRNLITDEELSQFSSETQAAVKLVFG